MTRRRLGRSAVSRQLWAAALLGLVLYAVAVGAVRFFDWSVQTAQLEQLRQEGPLVPVACENCAGLGAQVLSWVSDGRVLLVLAVLLGVATAGALVCRRTSGPRGHAGRGWPAT